MRVAALTCLLLALLATPAHADTAPPAGAEPEIRLFEKHPALNKYLFEESPSRFTVGFGVTPVSLMKDKFYFGLNVFQVHWMSESVDWQILSAGVGFGFAQTGEARSRHASLRTAPMLRLMDFLSVGPVLGYEVLVFPNLQAKLRQDIAVLPLQSEPEPFSTHGIVLGVMASQRLPLEDGRTVRFSQILARQSYFTNRARREGWVYNFAPGNATSPDFREAPDSIRPSLTLTLEVSLLF